MTITDTFELHGREYRKDEQASDGDEDVYSTRHQLYDVECPDCGSDEIEVMQWNEMMKSSAKAACDCGFEHREDYRQSEVRPSGLFGMPTESVGYVIEMNPKEWWTDWKFSPRKFLDMIEDHEHR